MTSQHRSQDDQQKSSQSQSKNDELPLPHRNNQQLQPFPDGSPFTSEGFVFTKEGKTDHSLAENKDSLPK